jgi:hypothetical protein
MYYYIRRLLKWSIANGCPANNNQVCSGAAASGNVRMLEWLVHDGGGFSLSAGTCARAARAEHLRAVKWLRGVGCAWDRRTWRAAACSHNQALVAWCAENGCPREVYCSGWCRSEGASGTRKPLPRLRPAAPSPSAAILLASLPTTYYRPAVILLAVSFII